MGRYALEVVPAPSRGLGMAGLYARGPVWIAGATAPDGKEDSIVGACARALVDELAAVGVTAVTSEALPDGATGLLLLHGLHDVQPHESLAWNRAAFQCARAFARSLPEEGVMVTLQDTGGDFGFSGRAEARTWIAGMSALAKTAAREWQGVRVKAVDLEGGNRSPSELARTLVAELVAGGPEVEVGLQADGSRVALNLVERAIDDGLIQTSSKDEVIVASGGARGVTAACLVALARARGGSYALLGRTTLEAEPEHLAEATTDADIKRALLAEAKAQGVALTPKELGRRAGRVQAGREVRATLAALDASGAKAAYFPVDIAETESVRRVCDDIRTTFGPITGIVHGAGLLADKLIAEKSIDQFDLVFATKVTGLQSLLAATENDPLSRICLFSSVAARFGNRGQVDYAMANEVLNKAAHAEAARRGRGCRVVSINWGAWDGGMVDEGLKQAFKARGVSLIPQDEGAERFAQEWSLSGASPASLATEILIGPPPDPGGLGGPAQQGEHLFDVYVDSASYPCLSDHKVQDAPVLPLVLVVEWFARAIAAVAPDRRTLVLRDLAVLKGVRLEPPDSSVVLRVTCRSRQLDSTVGPFDLTLQSTDGTLHYKAWAEWVDGGADRATDAFEPCDSEFDDDAKARAAQAYGDLLFHGPRFAALRALGPFCDDGCTAELVGLTALGWPGESGSWHSDPPALDGCLQAARLWTYDRLGRLSLPARVTEVVLPHLGPLPGKLTCRVRSEARGLYTRSDVTLRDEHGAIRMKLSGVDMYVTRENRRGDGVDAV